MLWRLNIRSYVKIDTSLISGIKNIVDVMFPKTIESEQDSTVPGR